MSRSAEAPVESAKFLGHGVCDAISKSSLLKTITDHERDISEAVLKLYKQISIPATELRGIGIQVTKLVGVEKTSTGPTLQSFLDRKKNKQKSLTPKKANIPVKRATPIKEISLPSAKDIDKDILNSLPENIRREVLKEYGIKEIPCITKTVEDDLEQTVEDVLSDVSAEELRDMIVLWLKESQPQTCDIEMLSIHLTQLVKKRHLEPVERIIKTFYRLILEVNASTLWITAYKSITSQVQTAMLSTYEMPMLLPSFHDGDSPFMELF